MYEETNRRLKSISDTVDGVEVALVDAASDLLAAQPAIDGVRFWGEEGWAGVEFRLRDRQRTVPLGGGEESDNDDPYAWGSADYTDSMAKDLEGLVFSYGGVVGLYLSGKKPLVVTREERCIRDN